MKKGESFGDRGISRSHIDTTDASTVLHQESHVAILTPGGSPIIPQDPVLLTRLRVCAEANQHRSMVEISTALWTVKDAMLVVKEDIFISLHCYGDRLLSDGGLQLRDVVWLHVVALRDIDAS